MYILYMYMLYVLFSFNIKLCEFDFRTIITPT